MESKDGLKPPTIEDLPTNLADQRVGTPISSKKTTEEAFAARNIRLVDAEEELEDMEAAAEKIDRREDLMFQEEYVEAGRHKSGLEMCHQLFLYGLPEGPRKNVPIRRSYRLAKLTLVPKELIEPHMSTWSKEAMRLARSASPIHAFACSREAMTDHTADIKKMRAGIVEMEEGLSVLEVGSKDYQNMQRLLMSARKEWQDASGIASGIRISEAAAKIEAAAMLAAIHADERGGPVSGGDEVKLVSGPCFDID